jgi:hemerythrin-like domain-containing protein
MAADQHPSEKLPTAHFGFEPCALSVTSKSGAVTLQCVADTSNKYGLSVNLARPLSWDAKKDQWRWHKTWRLPDVAFSADVEALGSAGGVEARLSVVCTSNTSAHQLEDAGVTSTASGPSGADANVSMVDGRARFSRLRLLGTTATFGGRAFHIVVSLLRRDPATGNCSVLASVISTPFAVFSRKNADKQKQPIDRARIESGRWSEGYSFVPFEPSELKKSFVKKSTGPDGKTEERVCDNSWIGLMDYFTAQNIRHKVRHPLFLAIRFSNVLCILRDSLRFPMEDEEALRSFICSCGFPLGCITDPAVAIGHGEFLPCNLIALRSSAFPGCPPKVRDKLIHLLSVVKGPALGFVPDDKLVPSRYKAVCNVDKLIPLYTRLHAREFATAPSEQVDCPVRKRAKFSPSLEDADGSSHSNNSSSIQHLKQDMNSQLARTIHPPPAPATEYPVTPSSLMNKLGVLQGSVNSGSLVGYFPQVKAPDVGDGLAKPTLDNSNGTAASTATTADLGNGAKAAFAAYFRSLHQELRMLLAQLVQAATDAVSNRDAHAVHVLRSSYQDFTEALIVHAYVEENYFFKELAAKVPHVTDSYSLDHEHETLQLKEIEAELGMDGNMRIVNDMQPAAYAKLFMKVSELAAVHNNHMAKEELLLLPLLVKTMSDKEVKDILDVSKRVSVNLRNSRHAASINAARLATGLPEEEHDLDPPDSPDSPGLWCDYVMTHAGDDEHGTAGAPPPGTSDWGIGLADDGMDDAPFF